MKVITLLIKIKDHLFTAIETVFFNLRSTRQQMIWAFCAMFIFSVMYGLKNPSDTASSAITACASVFGIVLSGYIGSKLYERKLNGSNGHSTPPPTKDVVDPNSQED